MYFWYATLRHPSSRKACSYWVCWHLWQWNWFRVTDFCDEEYRLTHWNTKLNLSRAAINDYVRNPMTETISNFTSSHTIFRRLNEMTYTMAIDSGTSGKGCYTRLPDPNNLQDNDYRHFVYCNPVQCIKFLMQKAAFREHMSCTPAKRFNDAEEYIYSEVKSSNW